MQSNDRSTRQSPDDPTPERLVDGIDPGDEVSLTEHRLVERRGEEVLQLSFTVHQDLLEIAATTPESARPALRSAQACNAAVVTLCQHLLADRRARIAALARRTGEPAGPLDAEPRWSLNEAWLVVDTDDEVVGVSDDACAALARHRGQVVGGDLAELLGVDPADVRALLGAADDVGTATAGVHVVTPRVDRHLRLELHRLPGTRNGLTTFVALLHDATNPPTDVSERTDDPRGGAPAS